MPFSPNYRRQTFNNIMNSISSPPKKNELNAVRYSCNDVWAASAAADRLNLHEYLKHNRFDTDGKMVQQANRVIMQELLSSPDKIEEQDRAMGLALQEHVRGWIFKIMEADCNDYVKAAVKMTDQETLGSDSIGFLASLPSSIRRDQEFVDVRSEINALSTKGYVGKPSEGIQGEMTILQVWESKRFDGHVVRGNLDGYFIWFFSSTGFAKGNKYTIKGRVKQHCPSGGTQLHYVKIIKP